MTLTPIYEFGDYWGGLTESVSYDLGVKSTLSEDVRIDAFYLINKISNPQESNLSPFSFAIHFNSMSWDNLSDPNLQDVYYSIPYPTWYKWSPGNFNESPIMQNPLIFSQINIPNYGISAIDEKYRSLKSFIIKTDEIFDFKLTFAPKYRMIDFYDADLYVEYTVLNAISEGVHESGRLKNRIRAELVSPIGEIDQTQFPELVFHVHGIESGNILTIQ